MKALAAALMFSVLAPTAAFDGSGTLMEYTIIYQHPQTGDACYGDEKMLASSAVPAAASAEATASAAMTFSQVGPDRYVNINLAGTDPAMVPRYVSDSITPEGTWEYSMKLNVAALRIANGTTQAGRQATVDSAKYFLLAMADNMRRLSRADYRLRVQFDGLPSQSGLSGTPLYATTLRPYAPGDRKSTRLN